MRANKLSTSVKYKSLLMIKYILTSNFEHITSNICYKNISGFFKIYQLPKIGKPVRISSEIKICVQPVNTHYQSMRLWNISTRVYRQICLQFFHADDDWGVAECPVPSSETFRGVVSLTRMSQIVFVPQQEVRSQTMEWIGCGLAEAAHWSALLPTEKRIQAYTSGEY